MLLPRPLKLQDYLKKKKERKTERAKRNVWRNKVHQEGSLPTDHSFHISREFSNDNEKHPQDVEGEGKWCRMKIFYQILCNTIITMLLSFISWVFFVFSVGCFNWPIECIDHADDRSSPSKRSDLWPRWLVLPLVVDMVFRMNLLQFQPFFSGVTWYNNVCRIRQQHCISSLTRWNDH